MLSGIITAVLLCLFIAGTFWAWSGKRRAEFEEAAALPLHDEIADDEGDRP